MHQRKKKRVGVYIDTGPADYDVVFQLANSQGISPTEYARRAFYGQLHRDLTRLAPSPLEEAEARRREHDAAERDAEMLAAGWTKDGIAWTKPDRGREIVGGRFVTNLRYTELRILGPDGVLY